MKKTTLFVALAATSIALPSQAFEGNPYVQADIGYSYLGFIDNSDADLNGSVADFRLSIGQRINNKFRVALDYTHFGKLKESESISGYTGKLRLKVKSLGITGLYDFKAKNNLTPYVGLRMSYNKFDLNASVSSSYQYYSGQDSESRVGFGVLAGIKYDLTKNVSLNLNVEANRLAANFAQYGIKAGLRYDF
ncbi:hypothetical protein A4G19_03290 [Pasteurellaceae bacterium Macca]|nr:hypothetical protein [Pasteurellaceae bacterium Macca]